MTPQTVTHQDSLPKEFSRQEYWSGLPFPTLMDLPDPGIKPISPVSPTLAEQADFLPQSHLGSSQTIHGGDGLVTKLCLTICDPVDCSLPGSPSMEFPKPEYWSGLPFPSPAILY